MAKIEQLKERNTRTNLYPITITDAIFNSDGDNLDELIENKLSKEEASELYTTISLVDSKLSELKTELLGDNLEETFNTLKAVQDWANEHGTEYAELVNTVDVVEILAESVNQGLGEAIQRVETLEEGLQADKTNLANFKQHVEDDFVKDDDYNRDKETLVGQIMSKASSSELDKVKKDIAGIEGVMATDDLVHDMFDRLIPTNIVIDIDLENPNGAKVGTGIITDITKNTWYDNSVPISKEDLDKYLRSIYATPSNPLITLRVTDPYGHTVTAQNVTYNVGNVSIGALIIDPYTQEPLNTTGLDKPHIYYIRVLPYTDEVEVLYDPITLQTT